MPVGIRTSAIVMVAAAALVAPWALAAAVQPVTHRFVKGEHFRYSNVLSLTLGEGEGVIAHDGPQNMTTVDVVDVSPSGATLAKRVDANPGDLGKGSAIASSATIRASPDGTWRDIAGGIVENFVTWDPVQLGAQPSALTAGQRWQFVTPRKPLIPPSDAVVRVVSVGPDTYALHVDSAPVIREGGIGRHTTWWYADIVFEHGTVRDFHRVDMQHGDGPPGTRSAARFDGRMRLVLHTVP